MGFVQRRLAHETAIHCWDAVGALGRDEAVEPRLAADGVAEFLEEVLPGMSPISTARSSRSDCSATTLMVTGLFAPAPAHAGWCPTVA